MENVLWNIALILVATKVGGMISRKFKMPEVLGALVAGTLLGPIAFNLIQYDDNLKLLSNLGVIFLMFLAGLETDITEFKKAGKSASFIAVMGIFVPLVLGTLCAFLFFTNVEENIFIGVILTATSVSITVETLAELGKLNTRSGVNILGAAVIDDVLGLVLISVLLASFGREQSGQSLATTLLMVGAFCAAGVLAIALLPKFLNKMTKNIRPNPAILTFSLAAALLVAVIAERFGIAAITGAYLCGLLLSQINHKEYLLHNVKAISSGFLSPIFFASVGLEANLNGVNSEVFVITAVMFAVAVLGKVIGCSYAARVFKMSHSESVQIGVGMISRGEVAIITANIGLQSHIISQEVFIPTIIVVILTTIITPILLKLSFSNKNTARLDTLDAQK